MEKVLWLNKIFNFYWENKHPCRIGSLDARFFKEVTDTFHVVWELNFLSIFHSDSSGLHIEGFGFTWQSKMINFLFPDVLEKWSFQKSSTGIWSCLLYYLERLCFFSRKIWYFFFRRKIKDDLSQEIHENMMFSLYMYKCYKYHITHLQQKKKKKKNRWPSPEKKNLKVIEIPVRILERLSTVLCPFTETFIGVFIYCFLVKK